MSKNYDNWERLVRAVLCRETDRQIALNSSCSVSSRSSTSNLTSSLFDHDDQSLVGAKSNQFPVDYSDVEIADTDWKTLLPLPLPPGKQEAVWKPASTSVISNFGFNHEKSVVGEMKTQFPVDYSDVEIDDTDWKTLLPLPLPPGKQEAMWKSASTSIISSSRFNHDKLVIDGEMRNELPADYADLWMTHTDWKTLLPPDKHEVVWKSASQSFFLDKRTGKNCFILGASKLLMLSDGDYEFYWEFKSHPKSRFLEVAELINSLVLDIRGSIKTQMLTPETLYAAYLVFGLSKRCASIKRANSSIKCFRDESDCQAQVQIVQFQPGNGGRGDGWLEVEIGDFYVNEGDHRNVEVKLLQLSAYEMNGLIVEGIEFRPKRKGRGKGLFSNFRISS